MWDETESGSLRSVVGDIEIVKESADANISRLTLDGHTLDDVGGPSSTGVLYNVEHGPEKLPSEYFEFFRKNGWVCLTSILPPLLLEELEKVACTDRFAHLKFDRSSGPFSQSWGIARAAAEPVSLWLIRE